MNVILVLREIEEQDCNLQMGIASKNKEMKRKGKNYKEKNKLHLPRMLRKKS